ncbi:MAG: hypothetical protein VW258_08890, partial [Thalassolituus sp.]
LMKFLNKEMIDCLCCGSSICKPLEGQVVTCSKCYSEVTARREHSVDQSSWKVLVLISVVPILSVFIGHYFKNHPVFFVFLSAVIVISINKYLFGSYFFSHKPVTKYVYVHGHSFPEEVRLRKETLNAWLEKAGSDYIGFIRYLFCTDYVWKGLNSQQQKVLMELHAKTDTLPSQDQIAGWSSDRLQDDLKRIDALDGEYELQLRAIVESLDELSLDFQPEALE